MYGGKLNIQKQNNPPDFSSNDPCHTHLLHLLLFHLLHLLLLTRPIQVSWLDTNSYNPIAPSVYKEENPAGMLYTKSDA